MSNLSSRLDALRPKIEELMRIGGTPGLSLGVMHQGNQVYYASYGYRDVEQALPPNDETILPVCSMTKAVTSAALGILIDEKKAAWDTLVKDTLPALNIKDDILQNHMTIADLLCHRSGMSWGDNLIIGTDNNILISEKDSMAYLNSQTRLLPFRGQFAYNNLAYELAGKVIESLSKESFFDFIQSTSAATNLEWYPNLIKELQQAQKNGTSPRELASYAGTYWDALHAFKVVVTVENNDLYWAPQGLESEKFQLTHYEDDIFTWLQPRNELSRRGRWVGPDQGPSFWKVEFKAGPDGKPDRLYWVHDNDVPADEYKKE